jgi:iron complex outermembrane recepter protein
LCLGNKEIDHGTVYYQLYFSFTYMKRFCLLTALVCIFFSVNAQSNTDSLQVLSEVVVKGFESNRKLLETSASVNILNQKAIQRYSSITLVPAFNTVPGVRMEERSPGSYRLSIRGSLLRSPFGIRNIKIYIDDIPFTDAGGNSYFNLIDPNSLGTAEILKGPASSLYGAGTGGAVILNVPKLGAGVTDSVTSHHLKAQLQGGSYGLFGENVSWQMNTKNYGLQLTQSHLQSDGYRDNSRLRKDVVHFADDWNINKKDELKLHLLLADLYYQTPGGLNLAQWQANPRQSRPATATLPSAIDQKIAIYNKTIFSGLSNTFHFSDKLSNVTSAVFSYTDFKNPFITNYEKRKESSRGIRTKFVYTTHAGAMPLRLIAGGEWQTTFANIDNYGNRNGVADTVQSKDEVNAYQRFYFAQADLDITDKLLLSAGASHNGFTYRYIRTSEIPTSPKKKKQFDPVLSPRFALLYKLTKLVAARVSVSKGFSAPTVAEVRPSEGSFFESLQPEFGWNYEAGIRADLLNHRLQLDVNVYEFDLSNTIVRRVANNGGEYFVNAGGTRQKGAEIAAAYYILRSQADFISSLKVWTSLTFNDYKFKNYKVGDASYAENELTGVPKSIIVSGADLETGLGIYLNTTFNYTSKLPLTDANSFYAEGYHLLQCRVGYRHELKKIRLEFFAGGDNLLNENYSLGNDINAVGNRFYNAAPLRNYFTGAAINF